jgi:hypothetical protein
MQHRFYNLRGIEYMLAIATFRQNTLPELLKEFDSTKAETGKFTPQNLGDICNKYRVPVVTAVKLLEESERLPSGTWERLQDRGCTARSIGVVWD